MKWINERVLRLEDDGPENLHTWDLSRALQAETGDRPSAKTSDGKLVQLNFHVDLSADAKAAVESIVAAHDGAAATAADAADAADKEGVRVARQSRYEVLQQKRRDNQPLTPAETTEVLDFLMGVTPS